MVKLVAASVCRDWLVLIATNRRELLTTHALHVKPLHLSLNPKTPKTKP